eukprot:16247-Heterococcus_DN1.PRE.3
MCTHHGSVCSKNYSYNNESLIEHVATMSPYSNHMVQLCCGALLICIAAACDVHTRCALSTQSITGSTSMNATHSASFISSHCGARG